MTSIALGVFIIFIIYVMVWSIRNDGARSIAEQTGFIRMRRPSKEKPKLGTDTARTPATPQDPTKRSGGPSGPAPSKASLPRPPNALR